MKKILIFSILLLNISCMNFSFFRKASLDKLSETEREEKIEKTYSELNFKYYKMLENEIKEKDRNSLEEKYKKLKEDLSKINTMKSSKEHINFLYRYNKEINLKLQYLKDLK
ncbi:hypothetical protein [Fusobacterium russii]|uniref:hypothetical protein n=1 Tax=Fusobacterium russii TaxID=854 RepID=UPI0003A98F94|nr:hypothetical protein [Fusobacterium russii]